MVKQSEIALKAGVSLATVSLALNNHPRVSARTRQKVMEVAKEFGYVPNHAARKLAQRRFGDGEVRGLDRIAFVIVDDVREIAAPYLAMLKGAEYNISNRGGMLTFIHCDRESQRQKLSALAHSGEVDGWLLVGRVDDAVVRTVKSLGRPFVILGSHQCSEPVNSVVVDDHAVGQMAVQYLVSAGHKRIGFMGGSMHFEYQRDVLTGFKQAVKEMGLDSDHLLIQTTVSRFQDMDMAGMFEHLLKLESPPTAIFLAEPQFGRMALFVSRRSESAALKAMTFVAYEIEDFLSVDQSLVVIESPLAEVGRAGVSLLREVAEEKNIQPRRILIMPRLRLKQE